MHMAMIEAIESRTLFAVHVPQALVQLAEASNSPAVQATLNLVKADLTAINEVRGSDARAELQQMIDSGLAQLATGRDALRTVRNADPAIREAAVETLKATRRQLKMTITAAKANLRSSALENRSELSEATMSLRRHLKELRSDLRDAAELTRQQAQYNRRLARGGGGEATGLVTTGYNSGDWLGPGMTSSAAGGVTGLDGDDILVKYTYYGDADLNGTVDPDDFNQFLAGFQDSSLPRTWLYGDFDYNNMIDPDDFDLFLAAFQNNGASLSELVSAIEMSSLSAADQKTLLDAVSTLHPS